VNIAKGDLAAGGLWDGLRTSAASAIIAQCVQMICGMLVLRWVPPEQMGIWMALQAVEAYALCIRLGVLNAMNREYPFLAGKGEMEKALQVIQATAVYMAACSGVFLVGFSVAGVILAGKGPNWRLALMAYAIHSAGAVWRNFLEGTFRGGHEFARLSALQLVSTLVHVLTVPLAALYGFSGYCVRAIIVALLTTGLLHAFRPIRQIWVLECRMLPKLLREGLPLFASNYIGSFSAQLPRMVLLAAGGAGLLGLYAPVAALLSAGLMVPAALLGYLVPLQNFEFGRGRERGVIISRAWRHALTISAVMLPLGIAGWWLATQVVPRWLPKYSPSLPAMVYAIAGFVLSPLRMVTSVFQTFKAWWPMMVHVGLGVIINGTSLWIMWKLNPGAILVAIVQGTVIAQVLHALAAWPCLTWASRQVEPQAV
jgi:O-antigen/teichoic acid export membrane protein